MPAVTFDEARDIVERWLKPQWGKDNGTLVTMEYGYQDQFWWQVIAGARENLIEGDTDFSTLDLPATFVSKVNGKLECVPFILAFDRMDRMKPYGDVPA